MLAVDKGILQPKEVVIVVLIIFTVELWLEIGVSNDAMEREMIDPYQVQHRNLHHTLIEVGCLVLDNFDCDDFLGLQVLTLHHLTEGSLAQNIENEVTISV